ncbi:alpha-E domain-containing protein [Actinotalea sp. M2MS4P-6]|uniref:alpha-E domain-containing protein n=1 Tax=Actinotalea sp. M2MS4P-6 TaxID=2983762 RepID=UPI0021E370F0|nr:alpha-E domain-containing protein [Actinotalea sp. M2MS4P-6]MCV2393943.1 alpha-E domain-containing protein [Actinotalea sp. M2MS4P-6]
MLSRIAESLFWIGRYVERADDTARMLDVHVQMLLEDPWAEEDLVCRTLLLVMDRGTPDPEVMVGRDQVLGALAWDQSTPSAIAGAWVAARENARRAREVISTELWESINATWNQLPGQVRTRRPHAFFAWAIERSALVTGVAAGSLSRDDSWNFLILGRSLERADMTARLLATRALAGSTGPDWSTLLRSCGAHEAYLRRYRSIGSDESAAEFLLSDRLFPRSVVHALGQAQACLDALDPAAAQAPLDDVRRTLGHARTILEYGVLPDLMDNLPEVMLTVQRACATASSLIRERYFPSGALTHWAGGVL